MKSIIGLCALMFVAPLASHASMEGNKDACSPVFEACEAQGFTRDESTAPGKKIWADCFNTLVMQAKPVAGVAVEPKVAAKCKKFKIAKEQFQKKWDEQHKND